MVLYDEYDEILDYEKFAELMGGFVDHELKTRFPGANTEVYETYKDDGIIVETSWFFINGTLPNSTISAPLIPVDKYYNKYLSTTIIDDEFIDNVVSEIIDIYMKKCKEPDGTLNVPELFDDFENSKNIITVELVNTQENLQMLQKVPYHVLPGTEFSLIYRLPVYKEDKHLVSILVTDEHLKSWNVTVNDIHNIAVENTKSLFPTKSISMKEYLCKYEMVREDFATVPKDEIMYVVTNPKKQKGACNAFIDNEVLAEIAKKHQDNLFVLPNSVHECIVLAAKDRNAQDAFQFIDDFKEKRYMWVYPGDHISNNIYYYDAQKQSLKLGNLQHRNQWLRHSR